MAPAPRYLIRAATLMLVAVRVRAAGGSVTSSQPRPGGSVAGPHAGVRSAACPPVRLFDCPLVRLSACPRVLAAAGGCLPGEHRPHWHRVPGAGTSRPRKRGFRRGLTT